MYTGIVEATGKIATVTPLAGEDLRVMVVSERLDMGDIAVGDSIAVNGASMAVVARSTHSFKYDISITTQRTTVGLEDPGREVNLEKAMRLGERLGGHMVAGQIDGLGEVLKCETVGEGRTLLVEVDRSLAKFIALKGAIAVNGVSLSISQIKDHGEQCLFSASLGGHLLEATNLRLLQVGDQVNLEVDMVARYLERLLPGRLRSH
ncbi:riboflavin synthase [Chitinimonas sp.]|uniref:riboflavin synthase n=1 Tax=Chitinimonas sp. TaxID=1934313 RepID=UPI002F95E86C